MIYGPLTLRLGSALACFRSDPIIQFFLVCGKKILLTCVRSNFTIRRSLIQDITFASDTSSSLNLDTKFKLEIDGQQTKEFSLRSSAYDISRELNNLSASSCQDSGFISAAFRNSMEDTSVWPGDRYHRTIRPFCGSRTYALDQGRRKTTVFDAKKVSTDPIDLNINPHVCFAYFGQIGEKITVTVEAGNWRGVRSYDLGISPTTQWRYKCINLLSDYLRKDPVVQKKIDETKEFVLKQFEFSSVTDEANIAFIDEFIIGRVEGFFEVKPTAIGIQPSGGYIQKFDVDWFYPNGMRTLRISFRTSDCGLDIGLIKLVNQGEAHFEEIRNPLTHFYTYGDYTVKVNRLSVFFSNCIKECGAYDQSSQRERNICVSGVIIDRPSFFLEKSSMTDYIM